MAGFSRAGNERVNAFPVDDNYLVKHYFETDDVFHRLKRYYNNHQYRFEIPVEEFTDVRSFLENYGYDLIEVELIDEYIVVVKKYTDHPDNIFKISVMQRSVDNYNCFLIKDKASVEQMCNSGAVQFGKTDLENPF